MKLFKDLYKKSRPKHCTFKEEKCTFKICKIQVVRHRSSEEIKDQSLGGLNLVEGNDLVVWIFTEKKKNVKRTFVANFF